MRAFHFLNSVHGIENLTKKHLKISEIDKLNDPFEFLGVTSNDRSVRKYYRDLKTHLAKSTGIICFSDSWKNPVLWSHYAEHHRGLCLGFEIPSSASFLKVNYQMPRLEANIGVMHSVGPESEAHITQLITTKFEHWSYESEHRLCVGLNNRDPQSGFYFYDFDESLQLREVIIGARSTITRAEIHNALREHDSDIKIVNARLAFQTFDVTEQLDDKLWL